MSENLKPIIESLIFVADEPLSMKQLEGVLENVPRSQISAVVKELIAEYETKRCGFVLHEVAGGYQFRTRPEYKEWIVKLKQSAPAKLSRAALETLAIIAYKQPILRTDVEHLRRVDCGGVLKTLLERDLIKVLGRKDLPGRPMLYGTTRQFLAFFGLKDLSCLPSLEEMEQLEASWGSGSKSS